MPRTSSTASVFKSYDLAHKANVAKLGALFQLYVVYSKEYRCHMRRYWNLFHKNQIKNNNFSHLGSTKHLVTRVNASYLQICLAQACASLNNHLANINNKFNEFINSSSLTDKEILHQLRTINSRHAWMHDEVAYYPIITNHITDDYGNLLEIKTKKEILIQKSVVKLARCIYKHIVQKQRVRFPNMDKPRFLIDPRVYSLDKTQKVNKDSSKPPFDYWLRISTLNKGQRIAIPLRSNDYFEQAKGELGSTIELDFQQLDYQFIAHSHRSLSKPKNRNNPNFKRGLKKTNRQLKFIFNKQIPFEENYEKLATQSAIKSRTVAFDLGLCNLLATSEGELMGRYWLKKLSGYDKRIVGLASKRQALGLKVHSKRYDRMIRQVKGFIKTEVNRLLNAYFVKHQDIDTVVVEKLNFSSPSLSKRLNRIVQNFGLALFKKKLSELSLYHGFTIKEMNAAYSSQQCHACGYVDKNNRPSQADFKCLCCGIECNADVQAARVLSRRSEIKHHPVYQSPYKGVILAQLKKDFLAGVDSLLRNGKTSRQRLHELLKNNPYFKEEIKRLDSCAEATAEPGLAPVTVSLKVVNRTVKSSKDSHRTHQT